MPLPKRGQIQLRGRLRWWWRKQLMRRSTEARERQDLPIVFGNAIPKSGSKLLFNILRGLPKVGPFVDTGLNEIKPYFNDRPTPQSWIRAQLQALEPGDVRFGYLYATTENMAQLSQPGWAHFLILRDPRDVVVSEVFYALEINPDHLLHEQLASLEDMEARLNMLIRGIPHGPLARVDVRGHYRRFLPWLQQENVHAVRFEDLLERPRPALSAMLTHLTERGFDPKISHETAVDVLQRQMAPEKSETFRKGKTGEWRNHFTERNMQVFKDVAGDLLIRLGYESDADW
jgi:hypothetical protein